MQFIFNPSGVATYQYELPMTVNRPNNSLKREHFSRESSALPENNSIITRSSKRLYNGPRINVIAIGLRYALQLTKTVINFNISLSNLKTMEYGGYCETEVSIKV